MFIPGTHRRLAKKRVQCLNEALCTENRDSVLADRLVLRNPLLRQAPNWYRIFRNMKNYLTIFLLIFSGLSQLYSQTQLPQKIKISKGQCAVTCGYSNGFHDIYFIEELEYNLMDSTFRFKKKPNKEFRTLDIKPTDVFTNQETYSKLDSLYQNFTEFRSSPGKYFIYRIELIYYSEGNSMGLPLKIKTMEFLISTNPNRIHPEFIDKLLSDYSKIYWSHKK